MTATAGLPDPYYHDERAGITIYHADCRDILPRLDSVDLVFADPPYNSGLDYGDGTNDNRTDYWEWLGERIALLHRVSNCVLVKHSALKMRDFLMRHPARTLVWVKPFSSGFPLNGVATHWEPIHWLSGKSVAWSKDYFEASARSHETGEYTTGHPAQMPLALPRWIVETFCPCEGTILDPFMGSGTTLRAAKDLGRKAIGIEIEERYCEIAAKRLAQGVLEFEEVPA